MDSHPLVTIGDVLDGIQPPVARMSELIDEPIWIIPVVYITEQQIKEMCHE